jgi:hypothetical protein
MNSNENFKNLSALFESENIPADEILWKEEAPFDYRAFIVSGRIKIMKESQYAGTESVCL